MFEVIPKRLWQSGGSPMRDIKLIRQLGIAALVDVAYEEPIPKLSHEIIYCRVPILDGEGNHPARLRLLLNTTSSLIQDEVPTLVACSLGISRSRCVVAAALALAQGQRPDQVLDEIFDDDARSANPALWDDLCRVSKEIIGKSCYNT